MRFQTRSSFLHGHAPPLSLRGRRADMPSIPATFDAAQGQLILEARRLHAALRGELPLPAALRVFGGFSETQLACIAHLLRLEQGDFHASLADALEPCGLRDGLRLGSAAGPAPPAAEGIA